MSRRGISLKRKKFLRKLLEGLDYYYHNHIYDVLARLPKRQELIFLIRTKLMEKNKVKIKSKILQQQTLSEASKWQR